MWGDSEIAVYRRAFLRSQTELAGGGVRLLMSQLHAGFVVAVSRSPRVGHQALLGH